MRSDITASGFHIIGLLSPQPLLIGERRGPGNQNKLISTQPWRPTQAKSANLTLVHMLTQMQEMMQ